MAARARKQAPPRRRGRSALRREIALPEVMRELAFEACTSLKLTLDGFGITPAEWERAMRRASRERRVPAVSGPILSEVRGIGRIIERWTRSPAYVDSEGKPRMLTIKGPGPTFETLARSCLPKMPLDRVVALAKEVAEVSERPRGQIALIGSILVSLRHSRVRHLAHIVRQLDQLLGTSRHNWRNRDKPPETGLMERLALGVIAARCSPALKKQIRPPIYEMLLRLENTFDKFAPKTARERKDARAVFVTVYVSEEEDLERAGVGPLLESLKHA